MRLLPKADLRETPLTVEDLVLHRSLLTEWS